MADSRYLVLARKWRPQRFDDVVGQEHITRTLRNAIASGRIHHAFLFIGSRGIGKTTTARILAKALNCLKADAPTAEPCGECENCNSIGAGNNIDVIEIDGASNNSVEDVREIRDHIRMVPTNSRYKVYIIDEVHQLSVAAFNALLKTLEEPPAHAIFILATTEAHRIPATIVSRCQRYDFRRVGLDALMKLLRIIVDKEGIKASDEALHAIARAAEGGVRDAEGTLDELITYCDGEITFQDVFDVLGLVDWKVLHELCEGILAQDVGCLLGLVEEVVSAGKDLSQFVQEILRYFRNLLVCKTTDGTDLLHLPEEEVVQIQEHAARFSLTTLVRLVEQFAELTSGFDSQLAQRIALESLLIRVSKATVEISVDSVLEKLLQLGTGGVAPPAAPEARPPENPPEAGTGEAAPSVPAAKMRRITVTEENLERFWGNLVIRAGERDLNLGVWAGQASAAGLDGNVLRLQLPPENGQAREFLERPEKRSAVEDLIRERAENLATFKTETETAIDPAGGKAGEAGAPDLPAYPSADPDEVRKALEDPRIERLVDLFKGRIAEVRRPS